MDGEEPWGLFDYNIGLWNDRHDLLHGTIEVEMKRICHDEISKQVENSYTRQDKVSIDCMYLFKEDVGALCRINTQYLTKWLDTCRLVARKKTRGNKETLARKGRRGRIVAKGLCQEEYRSVKCYLAAHVRCENDNAVMDVTGYCAQGSVKGISRYTNGRVLGWPPDNRDRVDTRAT